MYSDPSQIEILRHHSPPARPEDPPNRGNHAPRYQRQLGSSSRVLGVFWLHEPVWLGGLVYLAES